MVLPMGTLEPRAFERGLSNLDPDALTQFVADLWSERGRSARIAGQRQVRVDDGTGSVRRLLISPRLRWLAWNRLSPGPDRLEEVDAVVTNGKTARLSTIAVGSETTVIDPAELNQIATYALDEQERERLYRDHIEDPSPEGTTHDAGSIVSPLNQVLLTVSSARPFVPRRYVSVRNAVILLCCWLLVVGVGSPQPVFDPGADADTPGTTSFDGGDRLPHVAALSNGNVSALLDRHRQSVANRSAHLVVRHAGTRGGILTQRRWKRSHFRLSQAGDDTWDLTVSGILSSTTIGGEPRVVSLTLAGPGQSCESDPASMGEDHLKEALCLAVAAEDPVAVASSAYVDRYLNGEQLAVEDAENGPRGAYAVVSSVPPADMAPSVRDYRARAVVTPDGVVRALTVSYRVPADTDEERRTLSIQVTNRTTRVDG